MKALVTNNLVTDMKKTMKLLLTTALVLVGTVISSCDRNSLGDPEHPSVGRPEEKPKYPVTLVGWHYSRNDPWCGGGSSENPHYESVTLATRSVCEDGEDGINPVWQEGDKLIIANALNKDAYPELPLLTGVGSTMATFRIEHYIDYPLFVCFVKDVNNPDLARIVDGYHYYIEKSALLGQDGTLAGAKACSLFRGMCSCSTDGDISGYLSPITSILKFDFHAPDGVAEGDEATLTYVNGDSELAKATFTVGAGGWNTIYMAVPEGVYTGTQSFVLKSGETETTETLSDVAVFTAGDIYNKALFFPFTSLDNLIDYTAHDGETLCGAIEKKIIIPAGASIRIKDIFILSGTGIVCEGDATIVVEGTSTIFSDYGRAAIQVGPKGTTLTIRGSGSLTVTSSTQPGIGLGYGDGYVECGDIVICGGDIAAFGGQDAPGIGGSTSRPCGNITITKGVKRLIAGKGPYAPFSIGGNTIDGQYQCGTITLGGEVHGSIRDSPFIYEP